MWVPLSARIVSLMFRGLFIYLGYVSFLQHSAVRFIIEWCVHKLDVPLGLFLVGLFLGVQGTALQRGLRAALAITNSQSVCVSQTLCLKVRSA